MPKGISIHLGLNFVDPRHYDGWDGELRACEADARDMAKVAKDRGYAQTTVLLTKNATAAKVAKVMQDAAGKLAAGDLLFLTYSGHGGQVPDRDGDDEADGLDETWCLYDRQLVDDELYGLFGKFAKGVRIVLLSDSCHSGTVARNAELSGQSVADIAARLAESANRLPQVRNGTLKPFGGCRLAPRQITFAAYARNRALYEKVQRADSKAQAKAAAGRIGAGIALISGCMDNQLSSDGERNGLFTAMLLIVFEDGGFAGGYRRFHREIRGLMPPEQTPNLFVTGRELTGFLTQRPFAI
jgi:metacaspase-1